MGLHNIEDNCYIKFFFFAHRSLITYRTSIYKMYNISYSIKYIPKRGPKSPDFMSQDWRTEGWRHRDVDWYSPILGHKVKTFRSLFQHVFDRLTGRHFVNISTVGIELLLEKIRFYFRKFAGLIAAHHWSEKCRPLELRREFLNFCTLSQTQKIWNRELSPYMWNTQSSLRRLYVWCFGCPLDLWLVIFK